jgi:hypothetical protein
MKKRINSDIQSHLIRTASYTLLLGIAVCVIPLALAQRNTTKTKGDQVRQPKQRINERGAALPANIIEVTNTNDSGPGSLRDALAVANNGDEITFAIVGTITLTSGELLVDKSITISGPGADNLAVDGDAKSRVFHIGPDVTVTLSDLTITNGHACCDFGGGGIYNDHGTLTLKACTVSDSSTGVSGGGIYNNAGAGEAVLEVTDSTISGNSSKITGGGISSEGTNGNAHLEIVNSTLDGNSADNGGGIFNTTGLIGNATLQINNTTLSENSGMSLGGGISNVRGFGGGASVDLVGVIFKRGASGENIVNTSGTVTSLGYNLSDDDGSGYLTAPGDQINTDPMLGPLQDNGGPTFTHALLPGSPAIDTGDPNFTPPPLFDQRGLGFDRVVNGRIDIGSFEVQAGGTPTPTPSATPSATPTATPGTMQLRGQKKKVGGMNTVRLNWKGATSASVDVYRNDVLIATTPNAPPFLYTDFTGDTGRAQYTYRVCEAGTAACSNDLRVRFQE